jgi:hypothetical protein
VVAALCAACSPALEAPAPRVDGVEPSAVCVAGGAAVTVAGAGFTPLVVSALDGPRLLLPEVTLLTAAGDRPAPSRWLSSQALEVTIPGDAPAGAAGLRVRNPDGRAAERAAAMSLLPAPRITSVEPATLCGGGATVTVRGEGFAPSPVVNVEGTALAPANPQGCAGGHCTSFEVRLPATLPPDRYLLSLDNGGAACPGSSSAALEVRASPSVLGIETDRCAAPTLAIVHGAGFAEAIEARVNDQPRPVTRTDAATLGVALAPGDLGATLELRNPDGCAASQPLVAATTDELRPFFVAPAAVWTGAAAPITVHLEAGAVTVRRVVLRRGLEEHPLESLQAARPGELDGVVPAGLPAGSYDVIVEADACQGVLAGGVRLVSELDLPLASLSPSFATAGVETAVTVETVGAELDDTPLLYLIDGGRAAPLRSVARASSSSATAVAPGLAIGDHDLVAVTPSGRVGRLAGALSVIAEEIPAVSSIEPVAVVANAPVPVVVRGSGFSGDAAVTLRCEPDRPPLAATVTERSSSEITASLPGLTAGDVCVVRVSNGDPTLVATPFGELSALVVTNGARNLAPFAAAGSLAVARRAPAAVASRVTSEARFLYALGGDDGATGGALGSVEIAPVDRSGRLGTFVVQRSRLIEPRSFAGAGRIGSYLYLAGGAGPSGALDTVERARVLDPARVPSDLGVSLLRGAGPGAGAWVYRISAVVPVDGETLPSEPVTVIAPAGVGVTLRWSPLADALAYRVYRTPAAGQPAGEARLLAVLGTVTSFTDDGTRGAGPSGPLDIGALGAWTTLDARLTVPRQGHAVVTLPTDEGTGLLFAAGGAGTDFAPLHGSYEVALVGDTGVAAFRAAPMGTPRALLGAYLVDRAVTADAGDRAFLYFVGGARVTSLSPLVVAGIDEANAGVVGPEGLLEALQPVRSPRLAGAGSFAAAGLLFALGGLPLTGRTQEAAISQALPLLGSWSSGGNGTLAAPRALMGTAVESAFVFVLGGIGPDGPLASVERTPW